MLRIFVLIAALFQGLPTFANENFNQKAIDLIAARDAQDLESYFAELDQRQQRGEIAVNDIRQAMMAFNTTDPDAQKFLWDWHQADPTSIYAVTANAIAWVNQGHVTRGGGFYGEIYPTNLNLFHLMHEDALHIAEAALHKRPGFAPLAEVVARLNTTQPTATPVKDLLKPVMQTSPEPVVLEAMLSGLTPRWGGEPRETFRLCDKYAPLMPAHFNYSANKCKIRMALDDSSFGEERLKWARRMIGADEAGEFLNLRLWDAYSNLEDVDKTYQLYLERDRVNMTMARWIYQNLPRVKDQNGNWNRSPEAQDFYDREVRRWIKFRDYRFEHDPYNSDWYRTHYRNLWRAAELEGGNSSRELSLRLRQIFDHLIKLKTGSYFIYERRYFLGGVESPSGALTPEENDAHTRAEFADQELAVEDTLHAIRVMNFRDKRFVNAIRLFSSAQYNIGNEHGFGRIVSQEQTDHFNCRMTQLVRVHEFICSNQNPTQSRACDPRGFTIQESRRMLQETKTAGLCPSVMNMTIDQLFQNWPGFNPDHYAAEPLYTENLLTGHEPAIRIASGW